MLYHIFPLLFALYVVTYYSLIESLLPFPIIVNSTSRESVCIVSNAGADLGGPKGPRPYLLLNKMIDGKCKNVQNSNKIASNSLKMLEIVFQTIQNSTFSGRAFPG